MERGIVKKLIVFLQAFALAVSSLLFGGLHSLTADFSGAANDNLKKGIIADHQNATLSKLKSIPSQWIEKAKSSLHIVYGHTSHGSQITDGMTGLAKFLGSSWSWNNGGSGGALDLKDTPGSFKTDLGNSSWASITRSYLKSNTDINVVMWSWCGQVSGASESAINQYLKTMSQLEEDFPKVIFVYMTGHTDGTGSSGNLHIRNEQIRKYCRDNNKVLFDFADIESYDPDGNGYLDKAVNDGCHYDSDGNGSTDKNWAESWQNSHKLNEDWFHCSSAHSQPLTANMKAYAAWYMFSRIAGWDGTAEPLEQETLQLAPIGDKSVYQGSTLSFTVDAIGSGGKSLTYSAFSSPYKPLPEGAQFDKASHTYSWTPSFTQSGRYTLRFAVTDGDKSDYQDVSITVEAGDGISAFNQIQAEEYTDMFGVQNENCIEGGRNVAWIQDGDYISYYGINFGEGAESFSARVASETTGGIVELRLDSITGKLIGTCSVSPSGGWQQWKTLTCPVSEVTGIHELFLVFRSTDAASDYLMNINWFQFKEKANTTIYKATVTLADRSEVNAELLKKIGNRPVLQVVTHQVLEPSGRMIFDPVEWRYDPTPEELKKPENITVRYIYGPEDVAVPSGKYNPSTGTISFVPTVTGRYAITFEQKTYSDISDAYAKEAIGILASKGLYNWIEGDMFNPGRNITRAEFLYLVINALNLHVDLGGSFSDVSVKDFYCESARVAKKLGVSNGIGDNKLGPNLEITRQDMCTLVVRALKAAGRNPPKATASDLNNFKDAGSVSDYAKESMAILVKSGIIVGYNNMLYPKGKFDMQQAATVIYRLYTED